jgi:hypothetical protein
MLCAVCLAIFTPRNDRPRFYCSEKCNKTSYRIRRGNMLKRLNRKLKLDIVRHPAHVPTAHNRNKD